MDLRGVVRNGRIELTHGHLPEGTPVTVSPRPTPTSSSRPNAKPARAPRAKRSPVPAFGIWSDRSDLGPPEQAPARLRALTRTPRRGV